MIQQLANFTAFDFVDLARADLGEHQPFQHGSALRIGPQLLTLASEVFLGNALERVGPCGQLRAALGKRVTALGNRA